MKRLYIVRHGSAQPHYAATDGDFARRLTLEGIERIRRVGRWLSGQSDFVPPERIIASTAPRASQTADLFADTFGMSGENRIRIRELYSGGVRVYLHILARSLPDEIACAMIVGHNPAVSELLAWLSGAASGDYLMRKGDVASLLFNLPDAAPWPELCSSNGTLERYVIAASV